MTSYIAFLRGINVGGNNMIKMQELKDCLEADGFTNVRTYIQSGNVLFDSSDSPSNLTQAIKQSIAKKFGMQLEVVIFSEAQWRAVINNAPKSWGKDSATWRHNILILLDPLEVTKAMEEFGEPKAEIESAVAGKGVIYQSASIAHIGRTTYAKIIGKPLYKRVTIRNYNTAQKLLKLLDA